MTDTLIKPFHRFRDFYPFYLGEHTNRTLSATAFHRLLPCPCGAGDGYHHRQWLVIVLCAAAASFVALVRESKAVTGDAALARESCRQWTLNGFACSVNRRRPAPRSQAAG